MRRAIPRLALFLALAALLAAACATPERRRAPHSGMASLWHDFRDMPYERAIAIAGDPNGRWVGAASGGHPTPLEAEESALAECRARRAARRMQEACRLYATGDDLVWGKR